MPKGIPQPRPLLSNVGRRSCVNEYAHLLLLFSLAPNGLDSIESRQMNTPNHRLVEMHFGYENNILIHTVSWHLVTRKNCQCDCLFVSSEPIARLGLSLKCYPFQRGRHAPFLSKTNNNCSCLIIRSEPMIWHICGSFRAWAYCCKKYRIRKNDHTQHWNIKDRSTMNW